MSLSQEARLQIASNLYSRLQAGQGMREVKEWERRYCTNMLTTQARTEILRNFRILHPTSFKEKVAGRHGDRFAPIEGMGSDSEFESSMTSSRR
jgi:hypothetical protein